MRNKKPGIQGNFRIPLSLRSCPLLLVFLTLPLFSCVSPPASSPTDTSFRGSADREDPLSSEERQVIASARMLLGKAPNSQVVVNGRTFTLDCIGTVSAIFYRLSIDVTKDFNRFPGNGVKRLYASLKERNAIHGNLSPRPGDIVFWDNTWDANEDNNKNNDPLTHAGVVMSVDPDGTIHYVHSHIRRGVVVEVMNLLRPKDYYGEKGKIINHALALGSGISRRVNPERWLSGDLWNSFGNILKERTYYRTAAGGRENPSIAVLRP